MNLKDIVDKLASIDKLEKISSQLDQKIPGQQTNLDPKADVTAMTQALAAVRGPAMSPNAAVAAPQSAQPAQTMTTEPPQQDAPPPERRELQQKNRPGEPMGEELIGEQEVSREEFIKKAIERVNDNPEILWRLPRELHDELRASITPEALNVADTQKAYVDATNRDPKNTKLQQDLLADLERAKSALKPSQSGSSAQSAEAPKPQPDVPPPPPPVSQSAAQQSATGGDTGEVPGVTTQSDATPTPALDTDEPAPDAGDDAGDDAGADTGGGGGGSGGAKPNLGSGDWYRGTEGDYTIQKGDTLSSISKRTGIPVSQLMRDNNIQNPNKIVAGAKLKTGQDTAQASAALNRQDTDDKGDPGTNATAPEADTDTGFKFTPEQEKWLGNANRQDPNILARMPGEKPPLSYFTNPEDQARAREMNQGVKNLASIKNVFRRGGDGGDGGGGVFSDAETDPIGAIIAKAEADRQNAANKEQNAPTADELRQLAAGPGPDAVAARNTIAQGQNDATAKPEKPAATAPAPTTKESVISLKSVVDELLNRN